MRYIDEAESFSVISLPNLATAPCFAFTSRWQGQQHRQSTKGNLQPPHRPHQCFTGNRANTSVTNQEIQWQGGFEMQKKRKKLLTLHSGTSTSFQKLRICFLLLIRKKKSKKDPGEFRLLPVWTDPYEEGSFFSPGAQQLLPHTQQLCCVRDRKWRKRRNAAEKDAARRAERTRAGPNSLPLQLRASRGAHCPPSSRVCGNEHHSTVRRHMFGGGSGVGVGVKTGVCYMNRYALTLKTHWRI